MPCPVPFQMPILPDWDCFGLSDFEAVGLLHRNCELGEVARQSNGLGFLATPFARVVRDGRGQYDPGAAVLASVRAARWVNALAGVRLSVFSPVLQAVEMINADREGTLPPVFAPGAWDEVFAGHLWAASFVVVPPVDGWAESVGVWRAVGLSLSRSRAVYLLKPGQEWGR